MACTCGHAEEEHGHVPDYPGSTACTADVSDGLYCDVCECIGCGCPLHQQPCDCIAFEEEYEDVSGEDEGPL